MFLDDLKFIMSNTKPEKAAYFHDMEGIMGTYLNPEPKRFAESISSEIYVDKSGIIAYTNSVLDTEQKYICVSRPRRFGKSMAVGMLAAYYGCQKTSGKLFAGLRIETVDSYSQYLNKFQVISINMQDFLSRSKSADQMIDFIERKLSWELTMEFSGVNYFDKLDLVSVMNDIYVSENCTFVILIDEWDCVFREFKNDKTGQKNYLDFLRVWLKDKAYVSLAYMTGILPIKKYGSHSALNMFTEFSMTNPKGMAEFVGFTGKEVEKLCRVYGMDFEEMKAWYDGYSFETEESVYSPKSVVEALRWGEFDTYWNQTETYEALKVYIKMNFDGLKDAVVKMMAGGKVKINIARFSNDMTTFSSKDDVLTLLVHLGYLAYDSRTESVSIPNKEISKEYVNAIEDIQWNEVIHAVRKSEELLEALWREDARTVASGVDAVHMSTSILQYNDENALSYTIGLAFYSAKEYYTVVRELPTGKGFADVCFIPRPSHVAKPAVIIELKWNKSAAGAIAQIKEKGYAETLTGYKGKLLMAGIVYDKKTKKHECLIESVVIK